MKRKRTNKHDKTSAAILAGAGHAAPIILSSEEREAIARSKAAADRGEFATDEQVRAAWAKHDL